MYIKVWPSLTKPAQVSAPDEVSPQELAGKTGTHTTRLSKEIYRAWFPELQVYGTVHEDDIKMLVESVHLDNSERFRPSLKQ
jgi:hypothetical protein